MDAQKQNNGPEERPSLIEALKLATGPAIPSLEKDGKLVVAKAEPKPLPTKWSKEHLAEFKAVRAETALADERLLNAQKDRADAERELERAKRAEHEREQQFNAAREAAQDKSRELWTLYAMALPDGVSLTTGLITRKGDAPATEAAP